jgi:putative molybdopterin biosynthesis protein
MEPLRRIQNFEHLKLLTDARRLVVLRMLMRAPETLSTLGKELGEHPARVRHHLKLLEEAGLVEMVGTKMVRGFMEKYYRATANAFVFHELILPAFPEPSQDTLVVLGSHDLALDRLLEGLQERNYPAHLLALPVGSLEGLVALRQGKAQVAGCHLLDVEGEEYNLPYVRRLFPDRQMALITLAYREQGLIVANSNPKQIHSIPDLARPEIRLANRNPGSGTRIWLDRQLAAAGIPAQQVNGYQQVTRTHTGVGELILQGKADVGVGLQAAAAQLGLDFIPLFQERFDLVIAQELLDQPLLRPLLDQIQSAAFRLTAASLGGYETAHTGELLHN